MHAYYRVLTGITLFVSKTPAFRFSGLLFAFITVILKILDWENLRVFFPLKGSNGTIYIIFLLQEDK